MTAAEQILAQVESLPTLSATVARLAGLLDNDQAGATELADVMKTDPALTANLLRVANSAYFGLRREVTSVDQAVVVLGNKRVFEVAAGAAFARTIPSGIPGYAVSAAGFWLHSVAVAVISERLSCVSGVQTPDLTFTAGLLHDAGKLVIGSVLMDHSAEVLSRIRADGMGFDAAEREVLGTDHAEVGSLIADRWELPRNIAAAARWHHAPNDIPPGVDQTLVDLIHVGDSLAHSLGYGADVGELARTIEKGVTKRLGIRVQQLEHVACETLEQVKDMGAVFAST